jgi:alpha-L-fucosidase
MKKNTVLLLLLLITTAVFSQVPPRPYGKLPTARQVSWQETDMYCIVCLNMATFADLEWCYGDNPPTMVNPIDFSALQIVGAAKAGGFKGVVIVAKHHDGFCLWPTKTTPYNISNSSWSNGKGDMIKEYQLACQQLHMKLGLYCSPWDRNNALYGKPGYVTQIYRKQLEELYANYGPLFMSWHDGANGGTGYYGGARELREIDRSTYYDWDNTFAITRKMQPMASIFGDTGPDVRWVGNEEGHAGETCWETYTPHSTVPGKTPANGLANTAEGVNGTRNGEYWMPAECDVPLRPGWFYHSSEDGQSKTPYMLLDLYYKSVGRGACLDLGLAPDKRGRIADEDLAILRQFKALLDHTFSVNLAKHANFKASNVRGNNSGRYGTHFLIDNNRYSYWSTDDAVTNPELLIDLHTPKTFNVIRLRENIKLGQRIDSIAIDTWLDGRWKSVATATSIGATRLIRLPNNITASKLRLRIASPVCIALSDFGLFKEPVHPTSPEISRDQRGYIKITTEAPVASIHYTMDGTEPTSTSPVYSGPILLPGSGMVKARSFDGSEESPVSSHPFDYSKAGWKIIGGEAGETRRYGQAIDENPHTIYSQAVKDGTVQSLPESIDVDMGKTNEIKAFTYLPRQDKQAEGTVDRYAFFTSQDGIHWQKAAQGEFSNIRSNPIVQVVSLEQPIRARYFRFTGEHVIKGNSITAAEIGIQ